MPQTTLKEQFKDIEWCNYVWGLVDEEDGLLTYVEAWLLCGNYKIMKELPSIEEDSDQQVKEDLGIQRILAHPNFRGVVANKPVDVVRRIEDPPYSKQEHIYVDANLFSIEIGNESFLSTDEMTLHINLSRAELIKRANEIYEETTTQPHNR